MHETCKRAFLPLFFKTRQTELQTKQSSGRLLESPCHVFVQTDKTSLRERRILCELHTGTLSRHTAGPRSDYRLDVFVLWPSPSTPVSVNKHARSRTRSHLFESPLHKFACHPTNSSHSLPGPLAEREVQQDRGSCTPNSLQY